MRQAPYGESGTGCESITGQRQDVLHCGFHKAFSGQEGGRYAVGSILREGGAGGSVLGEGDGTRGEELGQRFTKAGFQLCSFPEITYAVSASCPHGTPLSFLLGARHMYTRLEDYIKLTAGRVNAFERIFPFHGEDPTLPEEPGAPLP
ncbi:unnamed protein product [Arctogadus glacialis]